MRTIKSILFLLLMSISLDIIGQSIERCSTPELDGYLIANDPNYISRKNQLNSYNTNLVNSSNFANYLTQRRNEKINTTDAIITIPVVFHIIGDDAILYLNSNPNCITQQMDILNQDYRKIAGTNGDGSGEDTEIGFCLASLDPSGNQTTGINIVAGNYGPYANNVTDNTSLKNIIHWNPNLYLNVWVTKVIPGKLAWGTFPTMFLNTPNEYQDGVVIGYQYLGLNYTAEPRFGYGRTLTHEIGHWLNLHHTWGDDNSVTDCSGDDFIYDTPICNQPYYSLYPTCGHPIECSSQNAAAGLPNLRQIENYMDYSDDLCMNIFTSGQKQWMHATIYGIRSSLFHSQAGCNGIFPVPAHCFNGFQDVDETGVDCGGSCPDPCPPSGGSGGSSCDLRYPDEPGGFILNNETGSSVTVCKDNVVINFRKDNICTNIPGCYESLPCGDVPGCSWFSQMLGICNCGGNVYNYFVSVYYDCDASYNCTHEIGRWFHYTEYETRPSSFNVRNDLPFTFEEGKYYKIKLAVDANCSSAGGWTEAIKQVYVNPSHYDCPLSCTGSDYQISNGTFWILWHELRAANTITTVGATSIYGNKYWSAGDYIELNPGCEVLIGSEFFAEPVPCTNARQGHTNNSRYGYSKYNNITHILDTSNISLTPNFIKKNTDINSYFSISPNPSRGTFHLFSSDALKEKDVSIYDILGTIVYSKISATGTDIEININDQPAGVYFVKVVQDNKISTTKIILM